MNEISSISRLKDIYNKYDHFILDQWGVMHDGNSGFLNAINCINELFSTNKILTIISNSSKRKNLTAHRLIDFGYDKNHFKEIITSGEMIWKSLVNESFKETQNLGKNFYHIANNAKDNNIEFLSGLEKFIPVNSVENSNFILGCTPFESSKVIDYIPILNCALKKNIPFICANPDYDTLDGNTGKLEFCVGTISKLYQNMGGKTFYLGKPSKEIYNEAIKSQKNVKKSRILAIGDSLYHDIKGANNFGIDSLLITSKGIHKGSFNDKNPIWKTTQNTLQNLNIKPTFICSELVF